MIPKVKHERIRISLLLALAWLASACVPPATPLPEPSPSPSPTFTATPSPTTTQTATPSLTPEPAWHQQTEAAYSVLRYHYGLVNDPAARVYLTLEDAVGKTGNFGYLPGAPAYVSILAEENRGGRAYYGIYYGWMEAEAVQLVAPSPFRGIQLTRAVAFRFGWVLADVTSTNAGGLPVRTYTRYAVVHEVPTSIEKPGHIAVGPDEWLPEDLVALSSPALPADAGPHTCRFIYVDLAEQTLRVYDRCELVFASLVSTGRQAGWTFPGRFAILARFPYIQLTPPEGSISVYYLEGVPDFMTYIGNLGFHGAYWHDDFGSPVSHGCINLSPGDARWLFEWAGVGERVIISPGE